MNMIENILFLLGCALFSINVTVNVVRIYNK